MGREKQKKKIVKIVKTLLKEGKLFLRHYKHSKFKSLKFITLLHFIKLQRAIFTSLQDLDLANSIL